MAADTRPDDGPVLIQVEYLINASKSNEFKGAITQLRNLRLRDGETNWDVLYDVANPDHCVESFRAASNM
ncbi:MAG: MFS transporter [Candidatus Nitrosopolaris sp.]